MGGVGMLSINEENFITLYESDAERAEQAIRRIIRGPDTMRALGLCLLLKERGHIDAAKRNLKLLQSSHPAEAAISFELGLMILGHDPTAAEDEFLRALKIVPDFVSAFRCLAISYLYSNRIEKFFSLLNSYEETTNLNFGVISELAGMYLYLLHLPRSPTNSENLFANSIGFGVADARVDYSLTAVVEALENSEPFALVRYGDGEGALWQAPVEEERINFLGYRRQRMYFCNRWFGEDYGKIRYQVDDIGLQTAKLLPIADIIGAPTVTWIKHEGISGNIQTFRCCVNAARAARLAKVPEARTSIHFDLLDAGGLAEIIKFGRPVCVITSHRSIAPLIEDRFPNQPEVEQIIVPPAHSDLQITNYVLSSRIYRVIDEILIAAKGMDRNRIFLVGAGYVGKLICLKLKELGFLAVDIGSVFDLILKFETRPSFSIYDPDKSFHGGVSFVQPRPLLVTH